MNSFQGVYKGLPEVYSGHFMAPLLILGNGEDVGGTVALVVGKVPPDMQFKYHYCSPVKLSIQQMSGIP